MVCNDRFEMLINIFFLVTRTGESHFKGFLRNYLDKARNINYISFFRKAAQCTAQLYSSITQAGALAKTITCVGHSLGAHICGMISNHLTEKQYKIVGESLL